MNHAVMFAGLYLALPTSWADITADLEGDSPPTLARGDSGIGVLQFSVARHVAGARPRIEMSDLDAMLDEFAIAHGLGAAVERDRYPGAVNVMSRKYWSGSECLVVWYASDGVNVALVTYVALEGADERVATELMEASNIVRSLRFT